MGVYINMEMPKSCLECRLYNDPWCMARNRNQWRTAYNRPPNGERQNDCPLVPVPPHGDLIDRDECEVLSWKADEVEDSFDAGVLFVLERIDEMPTIIPAKPEEEGET